MKFKVVKETKPRLASFGKYKAVACHQQTVATEQIVQEVAQHEGVSEGAVFAVMMGLAHVINQHLRQGDKVRLDTWGLMKLEVESEKVDRAEDFSPKEHIRGVRLHFLPESTKGKPELYKDIQFEKERMV